MLMRERGTGVSSLPLNTECQSAWDFLGYFHKYRLFAKLLAKTVLFGAHAQIWA